MSLIKNSSEHFQQSKNTTSFRTKQEVSSLSSDSEFENSSILFVDSEPKMLEKPFLEKESENEDSFKQLEGETTDFGYFSKTATEVFNAKPRLIAIKFNTSTATGNSIIKNFPAEAESDLIQSSVSESSTLSEGINETSSNTDIIGSKVISASQSINPVFNKISELNETVVDSTFNEQTVRPDSNDKSAITESDENNIDEHKRNSVESSSLLISADPLTALFEFKRIY